MAMALRKIIALFLSFAVLGTPAAALDINGELKKAQLERLGSAPTGTEARLYYNNTTKKPQIYNGTAWGDLGSGAGGPATNYASNPSGAAGTAGWVTANGMTITRVTSGLPRGNTTGVGLQLAAGTATTGYAQTCFTIDDADKSKLLALYWSQAPVSGYATGDFRVQFYNFATANCGGAATSIAIPSDGTLGYTAIPNSLQDIKLSAYTSGTTAFYGVRFLRQNGTSQLTFSDLYVGPGVQAQGANVGPVLSYTPTFQGLGTPTGVSFTYQIIGPSVRILGRFTGGTSTAVAATFSLPNNYTDATPGGTTQGYGAWYRNNGSASNLKVGSFSHTNGSNVLSFSATEYTTTSFGGPFATILGTQLNGGDTFTVDVLVPVNELVGAGVVNLAQNDPQFASDDGTSDVFGPNGSPVPNTAAGVGSVTRDFAFNSTNQLTDTYTYEISEATGRPFVNASLYPFAQGNNGTSNNVYGTKAYFTSASNMRVEFGSQGTKIDSSAASAGTTPWSTLFAAGARFRVIKATPGSATGFGAYNPGISAGLVPSVGLAGATNGVAACSGCVGENFYVTNMTGGTLSNGTYSNITNGSIVLPAGNWKLTYEVTAQISPSATTNAETVAAFSIYNGTATITGTERTAGFRNTTGSGTVPFIFAVLTGTAFVTAAGTYSVQGKYVTTSGSGTANLQNAAPAQSIFYAVRM